jgi:hypothetical protein
MKKAQILCLAAVAAILVGCSGDSSAKPEEIKAPKPAAAGGAAAPTE